MGTKTRRALVKKRAVTVSLDPVTVLKLDRLAETLNTTRSAAFDTLVGALELDDVKPAARVPSMRLTG